jgi:VanZ family protein
MNKSNRSPRQSRVIWLSITFGLAATIAALTLMPPGSQPEGPHGIDKLYHIVAFAALITPTALLRPQWCLAVGCLAILYGGMIEVIQPSFGRSANISDFLADIVGVVMGILIGRVARRLLLSP